MCVNTRHCGVQLLACGRSGLLREKTRDSAPALITTDTCNNMRHIHLVAVVLVVVALLADHAVAGDPPMLHEVVAGLGNGFLRNSARIMSSDYYAPEKTSLKFHTLQIGNCGYFGCRGYFRNCDNLDSCSECGIDDAYAETQLTCTNTDHSYDDHYGRHDNRFMGDANAVVNQAGSCTWEIRRFTNPWTILEADGQTIKRGTVRGMCTISDNAENCNDDKKSGPLCGGMIITIDAYWYQTPNGWWKANQEVKLANDDRYYPCYGGGCNYVDSCCILDEMDVLDVGGQCGTLRRQQGKRSANGTTINAAKTVNPEPSHVVNGRRLQQASKEPVSTASYYGDEHYTGTYYMGRAEVFWGTFYATNQATGERWEEEGTFQWVVDTNNNQGSGTGTPPEGRYELEPNSVRFVFSKKREINTYEDSKAYKEPSEGSKERTSYAYEDSKSYKEPSEGSKERTSYSYDGGDSKPYRKPVGDRYEPRYEPSKERSSYGYEDQPRHAKHYRLSTSQQQDDNMNA